jgi:pimeloyl-ACP methyl ester carboxylesterase
LHKLVQYAVMRNRAFTSLIAAGIGGTLVLTSCASDTTPLTSRQKQVQSQDNAVAFKNCGSQCTGELSGAKYEIKLPSKWNGTLLLYSHGYRFAQPGPPNFSPVDTSAQVSSLDEDGTGSDDVSKQLLSQGYALAGSSYKTNGWAVRDGVQAGEDLHAKFVSLVGKPNRTYVWGDSLGGLITEILAEKHPEWIDGAAPMCGAVAGPNLNFDVALDVAYAVKTLIYPDLQLTGYSSADDAAANWKAAAQAVTTAAADTAGGGTAKVVLIGALVDAPLKTETYDGADVTSTVKALVESVLTALAFGTSGRYELEQRVGGNPSDNSKANYDNRLSDAEKSLITLAGGDSSALLSQLDSGTRVTADAAARVRFESLGDTTGNIQVPTITMHTENDPLVLVSNEVILSDRALAQGRRGSLVQLYIAPPATYSETTGAPYGAGHCVFSVQQRVGLINTLNGWVRNAVYPSATEAAPALGDGLDPTYVPEPWPSGATK